MLGLGSSLAGGAALESIFPNAFSIEFDGSDDGYLVNDAAIFSPNYVDGNGFSFGFWIKTTDDSGTLMQKAEFTGNREYIVTLDANGKVKVAFYSDGGGAPFHGQRTILSNSAVNDGNWQHIVVTWNLNAAFGSSNIKMYINGSQDTSAVHGTNSQTFNSVTNGPAQLHIMCYQHVGPSILANIAGKMDELFFVNDELSSSQVSTIYNAKGKIDMSTISNIVAWYRFGDSPDTHNKIHNQIDLFNNVGNAQGSMTSGDVTSDVPE